jgi:DNA-binding CsgD family transcriptional regulator
VADGLLGRDEELERLDRWLAEAPVGRARLAVLEGEPGIGKTAVARALVDRAAVDGLTVHWTGALEDAGVPPYWLWRQLVPEALVDSTDRFDLFERIYAALPGELLLVIDDIQWADESSLEVLRHLVRRSVESPRGRLLICVTRRSGEAADGWRQVGPDLLAGPDVERLTLSGLDAEAGRACLERSAGCRLDTDVAREAWQHSGGNPLWLRELGRLAATAQPGQPIPIGGLVDIVAARVGRLGTGAQGLLTAASVLGAEFELPVAARLLESPTSALLPLVDEARAAGLLTVVGGGRLRFSHGAVRSALMSKMPLQQAVILHLRAAAAIEDLHRDALVPYLADIARHWAAVSVTGQRRPAVEWARRAAEEAVRALAYEEGSRLYSLALDSGGPALGEVERSVLLIHRAGADIAAGRMQVSLDACTAAVRVARGAARPDLVGAAALTLEPIGDRAWDRSIREWCTEALASERDPAVRARLLARLSDACMYSGLEDEAAARSADALALAEESADTEALIAALRARQLAMSGPTHVEIRRVLAARMTALGEQLRRPEVEMWGRLWAVDALWEDCDLSGIAVELTRLRSCASALQTPLARWHVLITEAALAQAGGELDRALDRAAQAFSLLSPTGHPAAFGAYMSLVHAVGRHRGYSGEPFADLLRAPPVDVGQLREELFAFLGPASALAQLGRVDEALDLYRRLGPPGSWSIPSYFLLVALHAGLDVAVAADLHDDVVWFRATLEPWRDRQLVGGAGPASYCGPVVLTLGRCAAALGDLGDAERDLTAATQACRRLGVPGFGVEAEVELAMVLQKLGRDAEAASLLRRAARAAEQLDLLPWLARIRGALDARTDPLTSRERQVAQLVAEGCSNRMIASRLVLSERTAANHVQHILTKLGLTNRTQIGAWMYADPGPKMSSPMSSSADDPAVRRS